MRSILEVGSEQLPIIKCTLGIFLCLILWEDFLSVVPKFLRRTRCVRWWNSGATGRKSATKASAGKTPRVHCNVRSEPERTLYEWREVQQHAFLQINLQRVLLLSALPKLVNQKTPLGIFPRDGRFILSRYHSFSWSACAHRIQIHLYPARITVGCSVCVYSFCV